MNEEERKLDILNAEASIRELAERMADAIECTRQANMARSTLEAAARSMDEQNTVHQTLMDSQKSAFEEELKSLNQARDSLDTSARELQRANRFVSSMEEKNREIFESIDARFEDIDRSQDKIMNKIERLEVSVHKQKAEIRESVVAELGHLSQDINKTQELLLEKAEHLETSSGEGRQEFHELLEAKLGNLSQEINTVSDKLLFVMDQNEVLVKRILALQRISEELSGKLQELGNTVDCNSEDIHELGTQVLACSDRISSIDQASETKPSGLSHRLRSAIIRGGLGMVLISIIIILVLPTYYI